MKSNPELIDEIDNMLRDLEPLFPHAGDKLGQLATLYTSTYMLKLRATK